MLATAPTTVDANTAWTDLAGGHESGGNSRPVWWPHQSPRPRRRFPSWRLRCGSYAPHLCHERKRKPLFLCLGDDGTLVSCSFLKASAGDCSGWWSYWCRRERIGYVTQCIDRCTRHVYISTEVGHNLNYTGKNRRGALHTYTRTQYTQHSPVRVGAPCLPAFNTCHRPSSCARMT